VNVRIVGQKSTTGKPTTTLFILFAKVNTTLSNAATEKAGGGMKAKRF